MVGWDKRFNVGNAHQYRCRHQDRGYFSPYFVTNLDGMVAELEDPYILLSEKKLADIVVTREEKKSGRPVK